jgi:hypothetical protein
MVSRLEVADKTNDVLAMKEEAAMNGRMALFVIAIITCQLSPPYLLQQIRPVLPRSTPRKAAMGLLLAKS